MAEQSLHERFDALYHQFADLVEEMGVATFHAIESDTLKRVALAAGVDHTREGTVVIEALGSALQHERDVCRELRRRIAGLERDPITRYAVGHAMPGDVLIVDHRSRKARLERAASVVGEVDAGEVPDVQ